jgi:type II secretory pathway pseudopilin PulG
MSSGHGPVVAMPCPVLRTIPAEDGYSLIEMMAVVCLTGILGAMTLLQIGASRPQMVVDGAMRVVMGQLNTARETAISQRRRVEVTFVGADTIRLTRHEVPDEDVTTVLATVGLEGGVKFTLFGSVQDTPDQFGRDGAVDFGNAQTLRFDTDGSLIDTAGAPVNGTVFLGIPDLPQSQRAVTVMGSTGRVRGYRWQGHPWIRG